MSFTIGPHAIGHEHPLFVIAELGLNHGGHVDTALALVDAAANAGASAVKLQSFHADQLVQVQCPPPAHVDLGSMREFFRRFELDIDAHVAIAARARSRGLAFMSTPFDADAVDMLEELDCDAYKIASGDLTHDRLIERVAATGRPVVLSTGLSSLGEVADAWAWARACGARDLALLHCVSAYPVPAGSDNLSAIRTLEDAFDVLVGLSDHGTDALAAPLAVALGACLYERHVMLAGQRDICDHAVSSSPAELTGIVQAAARTRRLLGDGVKRCLPAEAPNLDASRRSLYATRDLAPGDRVTSDSVIALRPAAGLDPRRWRQLIGTRLQRAVPAGSPFLDADLGRSAERREYRGVA